MTRMTTPRRFRNIVVVGGSLAGVGAAERLRALGYEDDLTVLEQESCEPYERYPLSKEFLAGATGGVLAVRSSNAEIGLLTGVRAVGLDLSRRSIQLGDGRTLPFDGLVVATGARPRTPASGSPNGAVRWLRTLSDARALRADLDARPARTVIVGGGLIGSEVASAVAERGLPVTLIARGRVPLAESVGEPVARHLLRRHRQRGVRVLTERQAVGVRRERGEVTEVLVDDSSRLPADLVVWATGTVPNVEWLAGSGLPISDGVRCEPTSFVVGQSRVVAAGDVVRTTYPGPGGHARRFEIWRLCVDQAALAAENLLLGPESSRALATEPGFGTTIHGERIRVSGYPGAADECHPIWGSLEAGRCVLVLRRRRAYVGAVAVNATERLTKWLAQRSAGSIQPSDCLV